MTETELIVGAVEAFKNAMAPLIHQQYQWTGTNVHTGDGLYQRMRDAETAATTPTGGTMQASKAPARIDVIAWFVEVDSAVSIWAKGINTMARLESLYDTAWAPDDLNIVKAMTRRCESWIETAKHLLGDTPPSVPLREKCPLCGELWVYSHESRQYALKAVATMDNWSASCAACKTTWVSEPEQAILRRLLGA